jgi:hypothetical protein
VLQPYGVSPPLAGGEAPLRPQGDPCGTRPPLELGLRRSAVAPIATLRRTRDTVRSAPEYGLPIHRRAQSDHESLRTNHDETVVKLLTSTDGATVGFTESKRWRQSGSPLNSNNSQPQRVARSRNIAPKPGQNIGVDAPSPISRNQNYVKIEAKTQLESWRKSLALAWVPQLTILHRMEPVSRKVVYHARSAPAAL